MSSNPQDESSRNRLPFEPPQKRKKLSRKNSPPEFNGSATASAKPSSYIPDVVSRRMARRMLAFCGIPSGLGLSSFVVSYWIVNNGYFKVPTTAVLLVSLGLFGLGVLGLTYGILSASWEEDRVGSWWGWEEFSINFGRMSKAWGERRKQAIEQAKKEARQKSKKQ